MKRERLLPAQPRTPIKLLGGCSWVHLSCGDAGRRPLRLDRDKSRAAPSSTAARARSNRSSISNWRCRAASGEFAGANNRDVRGKAPVLKSCWARASADRVTLESRPNEALAAEVRSE